MDSKLVSILHKMYVYLCLHIYCHVTLYIYVCMYMYVYEYIYIYMKDFKELTHAVVEVSKSKTFRVG